MSVIGLRVGPFEIVREARVPEPGNWYRATRTGNPKRRTNDVFVRLLEPNASGRVRAALQAQFDTLKALADPRAPEPVAYYEGNGALILGANEGVPLDTLVMEREASAVAMSPATLLDIGLEISETLVRAHNRNVVHGHLSPEQVVLAPDGKLWIWGFGTSHDDDLNPSWIPPEIAREGEPSPATDQWCLGAILSALVTGKPPWRGEDPLAEARRGDPAVAVESVERQWPALGRVLRRLMDPQPEHRFGWVHNARQELLMLARNAPGASERKDLATTLTRRSPVAIETPLPPPEEDETAIETEVVPPTSPEAPPEDAPPVPKVRRENLPVEPFPVVRVDLEDEVPMARRTDTPARARSKAADPAADAPKTAPENSDSPPEEPALTELFTEPAPTEFLAERRATEMFTDRAPTELFGQNIPTVPELPSLISAPEPEEADLSPKRSPEPVFAAVEEEPSLPEAHLASDANLGFAPSEERPSVSDPPPPARLAGWEDETSAPEPIVPTLKDKTDYDLAESDVPAEPPRPTLITSPLDDAPRPTVVPVTDPDAHLTPVQMPMRVQPLDDDIPSPDELPEPLPEPADAWITRAAPWFAVAMTVILAAYTIGRYFG